MDMNQNMANMQGNMGGMSNMSPEKKSYGALIAVIIILALIVIGGLYFLGQRMDLAEVVPADQEANDEITTSLQSQNDSDDVSSIEADLNVTNIDNLDQGATAIESEIQ
jgi:hypothetical protein